MTKTWLFRVYRGVYSPVFWILYVFFFFMVNHWVNTSYCTLILLQRCEQDNNVGSALVGKASCGDVIKLQALSMVLLMVEEIR